jgi:Tfp pilus assembly protein PilN
MVATLRVARTGNHENQSQPGQLLNSQQILLRLELTSISSLKIGQLSHFLKGEG